MSSEQHENERPSAPPLCANNCGFYGSPASRNLCSKCYREYLKAEDAAAATAAAATAACIRTLPSQQQQQQQDSGRPAAGQASEAAEDADATSEPAAVAPAAAATAAAATVAAASAAAATVTARSGNELSAPAVSSDSGTTPGSPFAASEPVISTAAAAEVDQEGAFPAGESGAAAAPPSPASAPAGPATDRNNGKGRSSRCHHCNKKVGLLGFLCRCGFAFCGEHRYADAHECMFDYKAFEREQLRKQNNRVVADKLQKL